MLFFNFGGKITLKKGVSSYASLLNDCWKTFLACLIIIGLFYFSEDLAKLAARKYARIVQKLGFEVSLRKFSVLCFTSDKNISM